MSDLGEDKLLRLSAEFDRWRITTTTTIRGGVAAKETRFELVEEPAGPMIVVCIMPSGHADIHYGLASAASRRQVSLRDGWKTGDRLAYESAVALLSHIEHTCRFCCGVVTRGDASQLGVDLAVTSLAELDLQCAPGHDSSRLELYSLSCSGLCPPGKKHRCDSCSAARSALQKASWRVNNATFQRHVVDVSHKRSRGLSCLESSSSDSSALTVAESNAAAAARVQWEHVVKLQTEVGDLFPPVVSAISEFLRTLGAMEKRAETAFMDDFDGEMSELPVLRDFWGHVEQGYRQLVLHERLRRADVDGRHVQVLDRVGHKAFVMLRELMPHWLLPSRSLLSRLRPRMEDGIHWTETKAIFEAKLLAVARATKIDVQNQDVRAMASLCALLYDEMTSAATDVGLRISRGSGILGERVNKAAPAPATKVTPVKNTTDDSSISTNVLLVQIVWPLLNTSACLGCFAIAGGSTADAGTVLSVLTLCDTAARSLGYTVVGHISDASRVQAKAESKLDDVVRVNAGVHAPAPAAAATSASSQCSDDDGIVDSPDDVQRVLDFDGEGEYHSAVEEDDDFVPDHDDFESDDGDESAEYYEHMANRETTQIFDCLVDERSCVAAKAALASGWQSTRVVASHDWPHVIKAIFRQMHMHDGHWHMMPDANIKHAVSLHPLKELVQRDDARVRGGSLLEMSAVPASLRSALTRPKTGYASMDPRPALHLFNVEFASSVRALYPTASLPDDVLATLDFTSLIAQATRFFMLKLPLTSAEWWCGWREKLAAIAATLQASVVAWDDVSVRKQKRKELQLMPPPLSTFKLTIKTITAHSDLIDRIFALAASRQERLPHFEPRLHVCKLSTQSCEFAFRLIRNSAALPDAFVANAKLSRINAATLESIQASSAPRQHRISRVRRKAVSEMTAGALKSKRKTDM
jgi:hypothetical protein